MKLDMLKRNIGHRFQLEPPAIHLDRMGNELPCRNEDWIITDVTEAEIRLDEANQMGLTTVIGADAIHHYTSNRSRSTPGGIQYGLLMLMLQMCIREGKVTYRSCARPGERVAPPSVHMVDLPVEMQYPVASGLQRRLEAEGYRTHWAGESRLASLELEGWEVVVEPDKRGMPTRYRVVTRPENLVYIKTREPDLQMLANLQYYRQQPGLVSLTVDAGARALLFRFDGPQNAIAFWTRMGLDCHGALRCTIMPGRVDTVIGTLTEAGRRAMKQSA